jgi:hypothetical protein
MAARRSFSEGGQRAPKAVLLFLLLLLTTCKTDPTQSLKDQVHPEADGVANASHVIVGVILSDTAVRHNIPMRSNPRIPLQLRKMMVQVENTLQGPEDLPEEPVPIYYFGWDGAFTGPRPLGIWDFSKRRILWVRRDSGLLRTTCDGRDYCTTGVASGSHRGYRPEPEKPLWHRVADILLTRGEGDIDERMFVRQLKWGTASQGIERYLVEKYRHLALTEKNDARGFACSHLWIIANDRIDPAARNAAADAMLDTNCRCRETTGRGVQCE